MKKRKAERWGQFLEIIEQMKRISSEIGHSDFTSSDVALDQSDLSMRKLEELTKRLQALQKEKVSADIARIILSLCVLPLGICFFLDYLDLVPYFREDLSSSRKMQHRKETPFFSLVSIPV